MKQLIILAAMTATLASDGVSAQTNVAIAPSQIKYPTAPSDPTVIDNYFGIKLADPFRPLENDTASATAKWVAEENAITRAYLDGVGTRPALRNRLTELYNFRRMGTPWKGHDGMYYVFDNDGLQNQSVLYRSKTPKGKREVFLDPNKLSDNGTVALTGIKQSPSGRYTAYTISRNGSDWTEIYLMDTKTGKLLPDHIEWAKFTDAEWNGDDGFFYSAYDRPSGGKEFSSANEYHRIWYHKLGTPQTDDTVVFEDRNNPLHFHTAYVPSGQPLLFVIDGGQGNGSGIRMKRLDDSDAKWIVIEPTQNFDHEIIGVADGRIYFLSHEDAPKGRVMTAPVDNPAKANWSVLVPEDEGVLTSATFAGDNHMLLTYEQDAAQHVDIFTIDGTRTGAIDLPGLGTVSVEADRKSGDEVFYSYTSFITPAAIYRYSLRDGKSSLIFRPEIKGVNLDDFVTEQVFFTSKDGTKIPMFLTYRKGTEKNGKNPVYIYGYGGFNISLTPGYAPHRMMWFENGGVYAMVNLRGGAEYGEAWHLAGTKQQKQNVFDDFISAAEYLVKEGWTDKAHTAIEGGSNGGLLVGAVVNQRPDLYQVAIPRVGVMDMMRYHLFTIGWNWAHDYGRSDDNPDMAKYLLGYSPLHNIRSGVVYPAIMVTTADHDDRVVPAHSFKYAATLQEAETGPTPKLIRIDSNAGHGAGKPMSKVIDEWADIYTFIFKNMGITPVEAK